MQTITLVAAAPSDFEALLSLRIAAMRESLERIGRFDPERARQRLRATFDARCTRRLRLRTAGQFFPLARERGTGGQES